MDHSYHIITVNAANTAITTRVAPDFIFSNPAGAGFGIADPAGAGAECS